jgi:adenylate cyclase
VVAVKGRPAPLRVWEVVGSADRADAQVRQRLERYHEAVDLYRRRGFAEAEKLLAALASDTPDDGPTALYLERSRRALLEPPPSDWDGVHIARIK